jgi:hypothetical protein
VIISDCGARRNGEGGLDQSFLKSKYEKKRLPDGRRFSLRFQAPITGTESK